MSNTAVQKMENKGSWEGVILTILLGSLYIFACFSDVM